MDAADILLALAAILGGVSTLIASLAAAYVSILNTQKLNAVGKHMERQDDTLESIHEDTNSSWHTAQERIARLETALQEAIKRADS